MKAPFTGDAPDATAEQWGPRWERALQREQAIGPITLGHTLEVPGRTLAEQARILQRDNHPLTPSIPTLSSWRKAYLAGGRRVQALLDNDRGGKGIPRGWLSNPENQDLVVQCVKRLIGTSRQEYPPAALLRAQVVGRLGAAHAAKLPGPRALDRFGRDALPRAERAMLAGGERRYREAVMAKPFTNRATRFGEIWVGDNRKIDVLSFHGKKQIRLWIVAIIDAYSGTWVGIHISPFEPGSTEIALALRDAILRWGLPEAFYCDWGKDYASAHLQSALAELGTRILHAQPFSPWAKGTVEGNAFGTMSKCFDPTMPGYVGRNATERAHGVKAVLQFDELSSRIKHWALTEFNQLVFQKRRLKGQRACRLDFARAQAIPARFPAKDTLLLCLMKRARRTVSPSGISLGGLCSFWNHTSPVLWKLAEERAEVEIRYDPADMSRAYVFHRGEFLCEVMDTRAADVALSERDVRDRMERRGERIKALRDATREDRVAAMNPDTYMEYLAEQRAIEVPAAAVAGGGGVRPIRQMIPHLDRAASQIRRPGRPSGPRPLVPCQDAGDRLPDLADKPLPPGWE